MKCLPSTLALASLVALIACFHGYRAAKKDGAEGVGVATNRAIVHGATVHDDFLIGMGCILLNRVVVGSGSIVGAGAVCREGMEIPPYSLVVGVPAKVIRETTAEERERIAHTVRAYLALQTEHREGRHARA